MAAINWKNPANGDWNVAANWSTGAVPTLADAVTISVAGPYIVTISSADVANSLTFNASEAALFENAGSLTMTGALTVDSGFVSLNEANSIGSVAVSGGMLAFGNGGALGGGAVALSGGELLATANETLTNALSFSGSSTIAAAHGTTLNENASSMSIAASSTLNFGALGEDGTILWHTPAASLHIRPSPPSMFRPARSRARIVALASFSTMQAITVAAGATLDLAGNCASGHQSIGRRLGHRQWRGSDFDSRRGEFFGRISGPLSLVANGAVTPERRQYLYRDHHDQFGG